MCIIWITQFQIEFNNSIFVLNIAKGCMHMELYWSKMAKMPDFVITKYQRTSIIIQ